MRSFFVQQLQQNILNDVIKIKTKEKEFLKNLEDAEKFKKLLEKYGLKDILVDEAKNGKPFLGICLGMQMLFEKSYEYGEFEGLGLIKGTVEEIKKYIPENSDLKIPHMGWNNLKINDEFRNDKILKNVNVENEEYVYYVHSYFAKTDMKNIVAYSEYGTKIPGIVKNKNVYGMQFHPEKSGDTGLKLLKNWGELVK